MIKYEIINPSDEVWISGEDKEGACAAVLFLGEGKYGLKDTHGNQVMPVFIFGGATEWWKEQFGGSFDDVAEKLADRIAQALSTVRYARERTSMNTGQKRLVGKTEQGIETRIPYRLMTKTEHRVYSVLLPDRHAIEEYNGQMIPLRVLQVAAHAKECGLFKRIEIWHEEGKDDPLLVGSTGSYHYSRPDQREAFILARWGTVLEPFETLIVQAKQIVAARFKQAALDAKLMGESILGDPENRAEIYLRTGNKPDAVQFSPEKD